MTDKNAVLSRPMSDLVLIPRVRNSLADIQTIGELIDHRPIDLLAKRSFGVTALLHVRLALGAVGLGLRDDPHAAYFIAGHGGPPVSISPQMVWELNRRARLAQQRETGASPDS